MDFIINRSADRHPPTAAKRITSEGPMLNISKLLRNDAGIYTCEAVNSQGAARINITVIVECKCTIAVTSCTSPSISARLKM